MSFNQPELAFPTDAPINQMKLGGQNLRLFQWLSEGNSIHVFHPAKIELRIGYLNSRASDLINKHGIKVYSRFITVKDTDGNDVDVKEYSLKPFDSKS